MKEGKLTREETSDLGRPKAIIAMARKKAERIEKYKENPSKCFHCNSSLPYEKRHSKFCNHSCAATSTNVGNRKHGYAPRNCLNCGCKTKANKFIYCSRNCKEIFEQKEYIEKWIRGEIIGTTKDGEVSVRIRRWVDETQGKKCNVCELTEWRGKPIPLVLDHIDGNSENNSPENLRYVCRNCDGQLPTFSGRNRGKGRKLRREMRHKKI